MSRSLRKVVGLVGLAAIGFATFGIGSALFATFGSIGLGGALGGTALLGLTNLQLLAVGASLLAASASPQLERTGALSRGAPFMDPAAQGAYVFGTTTVPMTIVYEEQHGAEPDRQITDVFAHCWHRIESYQSLYLGGDDGPELVTFSGEAGSGTWANILWWFRADGTQTQSLQDTHTAPQMNNNNWPTTAIFKGVAHSAIIWNIDDGAFVNKYSSVPQRIDLVVEGAWLYDPRLDPTYGSGTQDFDDPTTWSFNNGNAALVLLRFLIGEYSDGGDLIWGRGAAEADIDMDSFVTMANIADETVDSKPRFRLGGMHVLDGSFDGFVRQWESETGGKLSKAGGIYQVWLPNDDLTAVTAIEEDDLLAGVPVAHSVSGDIDRFYNTARGRYIEPNEGYKGLPYPEVTESAEVADEGKRILHQDFSWVQDQSIAERIARIKVRRSRFQRVWTIGLDWRGQGPNFKPFTVHTLNCKETNNTNQLVRVIDRSMSFSGITILTLQEENASIYDDTVALGTGATTNTVTSRLDRSRAGRTVQAGSLALKINSQTDFATTDNGEGALVALNDVGKPDTSKDGYIVWQGSRISVPRAYTAGSNFSFLTHLTGIEGFIAFDTALSEPFTVNGQTTNTCLAFKAGSRWFYDNNAGQTAFTPTADMVALGWLKTDDSSNDLIDSAGLFGQPVALTIAAFPAGRTFWGHQSGPSMQNSEMYDPFSYANEDEFFRHWTEHDSGGGDAEISQISDTTAPGGTAVRFGNNAGNDEAWYWFDDFLIPYDGLSLYEVGFVVRVNAGSGGVYCGVEGVASDGVTMLNQSGVDSHSNQHYFAAANESPGSSFVTYRGYFKGWATTPTVNDRNDPQNPGQMRTSVAFIRPMFIVNFNDQAGETDIGALWVRRIEGALAPANASDIIFRQSTAPSNPVTGWIWIDTDDLRVYRWSGSSWIQVATDDSLLATSNAPAEADADVTANNNQTPAWLTTSVSTFDPEGDWLGFSTQPVGTISYIDFDTFVMMFTTALVEGNGNANTMAIDAGIVPAALRPSENREVPCVLYDSSVNKMGTAVLVTTGAISFRLQTDSGSQETTAANVFNSSGGFKGLPSGWVIFYPK